MASGWFRFGGFLIFIASAVSIVTSSELNAFNLTTTQAIPFSINGARVTFSDIPLGNETLSLRCVLHLSDGSRIEDEPAVTADKKQLVCRLPPTLSSGTFQVDLEVSETAGITQVYSQSSILTPEPTLELNVVEDWTNNTLEFTWDVNYFKKHYPEGFPIHLQATIQVSDGTSNFLPTTVMIAVGFNEAQFTRTVPLTDTVIGTISSFRNPYFYVLRPAASTNVYLTSGLLTPTLGITEQIAQDTCSNWLLTATGPPNPDEIIPCPNCHCKAKLDPNFILGAYNPQILQLAGTQLRNHQIFYQRIPTASGHAQSCSYNVPTNALATTSPAAAAWINFVSRDISYVDNYLSDIWPYIVCCMQTTSEQFCESFHQRRPIDTGHTYPGPDDPCQGSQDPHMITFDGLRYDFQGYGEFWLIYGPGSEKGTFGVQGRMAPKTATEKVTYYRAVALRDGNTTVQVQHGPGNVIQIILDGSNLLEIPRTPTTIPLDGASISVNGGTVEVRLRTGFTMKVTSAAGGTHFQIYGSGAKSAKGQGYMGIFGTFDGDSDNDFTTREGIVIPPTAARNLSLIHNAFGLTWMTKEEESFFTYEDGLSWGNYTDRSFGPIMEYPDPAAMPDNVRAICKENLACYYEYIGTGDVGEANETIVADEEFEELKEEIAEEILLCEQISSPANGRVDVEGYLNGLAASYSCWEEYELAGDSTRICSEEEGKAVWTGEEPVCNWTCEICTEDIEYQLSHDPSNCTGFLMCTMGQRLFLPCPPGQNFNRQFLICDDDYECSDPPGC